MLKFLLFLAMAGGGYWAYDHWYGTQATDSSPQQTAVGKPRSLAAVPVQPGKKVALVIGNSKYRYTNALANPKNDATAVAAVLKRLGFDVQIGKDLEFGDFKDVLKDFRNRVQGAEKAIFFYSGHGLEVNGLNYLVPVDAHEVDDDRDIKREMVQVDDVLNEMESALAKVVFLDACRNNPLVRSLGGRGRSVTVGRGLAPIDAPRGTLVAYATKHGNVAEDGKGNHSPYTLALLEHLETPNLELRLMLDRVRASVLQHTNERQMPYEYNSLTGAVYLNALKQTAEKPSVALAAPAAASVRPAQQGNEDVPDSPSWWSPSALWSRVFPDGAEVPAVVPAEQESTARSWWSPMALWKRVFPDPVAALTDEDVVPLWLAALSGDSSARTRLADDLDMKGAHGALRRAAYCWSSRTCDDILGPVYAKYQAVPANPKVQRLVLELERSTYGRDHYPLVARYLAGWGGVPQYEEAMRILLKYADDAKLGAQAQERLGDMYLQGLGVRKNRDKAVMWYESSATGNCSSIFKLGQLYDAEADLIQAEQRYRDLLARCSGSGEDRTRFLLGMLLLRKAKLDSDNAPTHESAAYPLLVAAAEKGDGEAQYVVGKIKENGNSAVESNEIEATMWYRKSAERGYDKAKVALKRITE